MSTAEQSWRVKQLDLKREAVVIESISTGVTKTFFVSNLQSAKVQGLYLYVSCADFNWVIDILLGVRKKITNDQFVGYFLTDDHQLIPEFLKKRS